MPSQVLAKVLAQVLAKVLAQVLAQALNMQAVPPSQGVWQVSTRWTDSIGPCAPKIRL